MMYLQEHAKIILYKEAILETAASSKRTQKDPTPLNQHIRSAFFFFLNHKLKFFLLLWKGCLEHIQCCYSNFQNTYKNSAILATQGVFMFLAAKIETVSAGAKKGVCKHSRLFQNIK